MENKNVLFYESPSIKVIEVEVEEDFTDSGNGEIGIWEQPQPKN